MTCFLFKQQFEEKRYPIKSTSKKYWLNSEYSIKITKDGVYIFIDVTQASDKDNTYEVDVDKNIDASDIEIKLS